MKDLVNNIECKIYLTTSRRHLVSWMQWTTEVTWKYKISFRFILCTVVQQLSLFCNHEKPKPNSGSKVNIFLMGDGYYCKSAETFMQAWTHWISFPTLTTLRLQNMKADIDFCNILESHCSVKVTDSLLHFRTNSPDSFLHWPFWNTSKAMEKRSANIKCSMKRGMLRLVY